MFFDDILKRLKFCIDVNGNTFFEQFMRNIFMSNKTANISLSNKKKQKIQ